MSARRRWPGCAGISMREHRGYVMDEQLTTGIQVGVDNKAVGREDARAARPSPGHSSRTIGTTSRATPARSPSAIPRVTDQTVLHVRFDPGGQCRRRSIRPTRTLIASINPINDKTPTLGRERRLLRRAVQQYRHHPSAGPSRAARDSKSSLGVPRFRLGLSRMTATPAGMTYADYLALDQLLVGAEAAVGPSRRDAVHRHPPDEGALDEADASRARPRHRAGGRGSLRARPTRPWRGSAGSRR